MQDVGRKTAAGAIWMVLFKLCDKSLGFISTLILVRLLVPADFGVVAMVTALLAMTELFTAFGFDWALIQRANPERRHFDTAWTMNVLCGSLSALVIAALAVPAARFYSEPAVSGAALALAGGAFVQGFENIGTVHFRRDLLFQREFTFQVAKRLLVFVVTIPLAWWLRSYWALVSGILTARIAGVALSYALHPYRPRFSLAAWGDLFGFSKWLLINNLLMFLRDRSADFVVGRFGGARILGVFSIGAEIANLPTTELVAPINRAIFPGYSRLVQTNTGLRQAFLSVVAIIALMALPAGTGISAIAPQAVAVLLGAAWVDAVPVVQIIAIAGALTALQTNSYSVFLALGRPDLQTRVQAAYVAILLPLLVVGTWAAGLSGAALAFVAASVITLPLNYGLLMTRLGLTMRDLVMSVWRPALACIGMYGALRGAVAYAPGLQGVLGLLACIALGVVVYVGSIMVLWAAAGRPDGAERMIALRIVELIRARRTPASDRVR